MEEIIKNYEASAEDLALCISEEMGAPLWLSQVAQVASGLGHFKDTLAVLKDFEFESNEDHYLVEKTNWCCWNDHSMELAHESNVYKKLLQHWLLAAPWSLNQAK